MQKTDRSSFDTIARSLAHTSSRRGALKVLAGVALAGALARHAPAAVGAACPAGERDCGGTCVNLKTDRNHCGACDKKCGPCHYCGNGTCRPYKDCTNGCCNGRFCTQVYADGYCVVTSPTTCGCRSPELGS
jgi:hypothetical protein